ncbi:hypothetical protein TNCV_1265191 [Trichonephila clavipes]|nr:hypothetical protein TNCV_1265191 [Trichonephila clavipes]
MVGKQTSLNIAQKVRQQQKQLSSPGRRYPATPSPSSPKHLRTGIKTLYYWTATADSDVVQSGRPIFDDFSQRLWPFIGNNTANVVFQMVKCLWLIRIDQWLYIAPQKIV